MDTKVCNQKAIAIELRGGLGSLQGLEVVPSRSYDDTSYGNFLFSRRNTFAVGCAV